MAIRDMTIRGMHCQGCVGRIEAALRSVPGVREAAVTLDPALARVRVDDGVEVAALLSAVREAGAYDATFADGPSAQPSATADAPPDKSRESLLPLFLIVGYIAGVVAVVTFVRGDGAAMSLMNDFMAGFFLVFSFFKMLDLRGFVGAYRMYDVVARGIPAWAWAYPFVELGLGVAYLLRWQPLAMNIATLALMLVGAAGVLLALRQKRAIRCACLGTALNLPMTTVTLVEDLGMAAMAAGMLVMMRGGG